MSLSSDLLVRTLQIAWHHRDHAEPIFGIDFHPFLPILATGGSDNTVRIWSISFSSVRSEAAKPNDAAAGGASEAASVSSTLDGSSATQEPVSSISNAQLPDATGLLGFPCRIDAAVLDLYTTPPRNCGSNSIHTSFPNATFHTELSRHDGSVNAVRFSPNGLYVASSADDNCVIIHRATPPLEDDLLSLPTWTLVGIYRDHINDVTDLCWSPDSRYLVSGSVDNRAVVWNVEKRQLVARLDDAAHYVQGVAWDPLGQFVASCGPDRTLRIYGIPYVKNDQHKKSSKAAAANANASTNGAHSTATSSAPPHANPCVSAGPPGFPAPGLSALGSLTDSDQRVPISANGAAELSSLNAETAACTALHGRSPQDQLVTSSVQPPVLPSTIGPVASEAATTDPSATLPSSAPSSFAPPLFAANLTGTTTNSTSAPAVSSASDTKEAEEEEEEDPGWFGRIPRGKWQVRHAIRKDAEGQWLFRDESAGVLMRRPCFSPDGSLLVIPAAQAPVEIPVSSSTTSSSSSVPAEDGKLSADGETAKPPQTSRKMVNACFVFARRDWTAPVIRLDGFRKAALAIRFSPVWYKVPANVQTIVDLPYRMVFAVATMDSVLIFDTSVDHPIAQISDIHYSTLTDLTWSPSGSILAVSSRDGYITFVSFRPGSLGDPIPEEDKKQHLERFRLVAGLRRKATSSKKKEKREDGPKQEKMVDEIAKPTLAELNGLAEDSKSKRLEFVTPSDPQFEETTTPIPRLAVVVHSTDAPQTSKPRQYVSPTIDSLFHRKRDSPEAGSHALHPVATDQSSLLSANPLANESLLPEPIVAGSDPKKAKKRITPLLVTSAAKP
eukprot:ANDGO_08519.mRNA.1 Chromatin assembly factor 1 subunit FAS2